MLVEKHPEIVKIANEFITHYGSAAHSQRRTDTQNTLGVYLKQISDKVVHKVPELQLSISRNTVHRLRKPPNEKHRNAKRFKSLVDAKVSPKRND